MNNENGASMILIVEDVEETRDCIEQLLKADGYRVGASRSEDDAVGRAKRDRPNVILVSPGTPGADGIASGRRIRERAALGEQVRIVVFCVETLPEGAEVEIGQNTYITRPDNFDQLRQLLSRLLEDAAASS